MKVETMLYGIFPKSEHLRRKIGLWERNSLSGKEICQVLADEKERLYDLFKRNSLTYYTDPLLNWYDIFRPVALSLDGIELGPLTRYLETNTFYRRPVVSHVGKIKADPKDFFELKENPPLPLFNLDKNASLFLPSPHTFYELSSVPGNLAFDSFSKAVLENYEKIANIFGTRKITLFDAVPYGRRSLSFLNDFAKKLTLTLVVSGPISEANFLGLNTKIETIAVDPPFMETAQRHSRVPAVKIIDAHRTSMDDVSKYFDSLSTYNHVIVTTNDYLDFLPEQIAIAKVKLMGKVGE